MESGCKECCSLVVDVVDSADEKEELGDKGTFAHRCLLRLGGCINKRKGLESLLFCIHHS